MTGIYTDQRTETGGDLLTVYVVRHGETLFNQRGVVQGWVDSPLTAKGVAQSERMRDQLVHVPFAAAYSSISERAITTAEILLGPRTLPLAYERDLKEFNFGEYEGLPNEKMMPVFAKYPDIGSGFRALLTSTTPVLPGGESGVELGDRMVRAFERIRTENPLGSRVLVVTHGASVGGLLARFGMEMGGPLENASLTILTFDRAGTVHMPLFGALSVPPEFALSQERDPV